MLKEDNQGAIELPRNPRFHNITKNFHFIRETIASNEVKVVYCPSNDMLADVMTNSLRKHPFLLALRRWGRFARIPPRETSPAAKSEEKRMFSQAT